MTKPWRFVPFRKIGLVAGAPVAAAAASPKCCRRRCSRCAATGGRRWRRLFWVCSACFSGPRSGAIWGAILFGLAGVWLGSLFNRKDDGGEVRDGRGPPVPRRAGRPPLDDFDSLREEVLSLRRRVELLEKRRSVPEPAAEAPAPREAVRAAAVPVQEIKSAPDTACDTACDTPVTSRP